MNETNIKSSQSAQGSLVQLTSYGNQDIYLTNNPEITFFKTIYRRYTNFGKIYVQQKFDNDVQFGSTSILTIQKYSDLLSNLILKIKLPIFNVDFINDLIKNKNIANVKNLLIEYNYVLQFKSQLLNIVNSYFTNPDEDYIRGLNIYIQNIITTDTLTSFYNIVNHFFTNINIQYYANACLYNKKLDYIYENTSIEIYTIDMFKLAIYKNMEILNDLLKLMYDHIQEQTINKKINVSWVDKIGIYMFEYFELLIGSNSISKISDTFSDIYGQTQYTTINLYNNMINEQESDKNFLYLQVPFWFIQNYGLSIPIATLHYNDIQFKIKIRNILDLININIPDITAEEFNAIKGIINQTFLNEIYKAITSQLEITVMLEYISLDAPERKKFIQSGHEYLITQVQELTFNNVSPSNSNFLLNYYYCCKNLFWCCSKYKDSNNILSFKKYDKYYYIDDYKYSNKSYYYKQYLKFIYGNDTKFSIFEFLKGLAIFNTISETNKLSDIKMINFIPTRKPYVSDSNIFYNSVSVINNTNNYFNYVQSYSYFNSTPQLGVNIYSYSLFPCVVQPSGACNLGRIPHVSIQLTFNDVVENDNLDFKLYEEVEKDEQYIFKIMAINYNVLRFIGGICGLAYQY